MSQSPSSGPCGRAPISPSAGAVGTAEFKARCLQIIDQVNNIGTEVTITKDGHPVAMLVPVVARVKRPPLLGSCKDSLLILDDDDLVPTTADEWTEWEAKLEQGDGVVLSA